MYDICFIIITCLDVHTDVTKKKNMTLKEKMKDSLHIGKHGKSEDMLKEMNLKMQRLLEETLEKNIQMEKVKCYLFLFFVIISSASSITINHHYHHESL